MDKERSKFLPDVPTTGELGYSSVISSSPRGVMGPKGLPPPITDKLIKTFTESIKDPDHIQKMEKPGLAVKMLVGEEFGKFIRDVYEQCKPLVEEARKSP
jgi:tripartite-type tricarboxylate transporter receptor subunit TctC